MGRNLARNFARNGFTVAVHNRSYARTESLMADHASEGNFVASESLEDFVASLVRPRTVVVMVQAGKATDAVISDLIPLLEDGEDRKSTRLNSSHVAISYAVFCLKK